jgi:hypothetical protein
MVDDVVAMHAAGPRPEVGRNITVADSKRAKVRNDCGGVAKREGTIELRFRAVVFWVAMEASILPSWELRASLGRRWIGAGLAAIAAAVLLASRRG